MNDQILVLFAVVVIVGTVPPVHLTDAGQLIVGTPDAGFLRYNVRLTAPVVTPVVKVNVTVPDVGKVAVKTVPFARLMLVVPAASVPNAEIVSL
jgi:hypothetical protein